MYYMVREQRQRPSLHKLTTIAFVNTLPTWYGHVNIIQPNQSSNEDGGARGAPASGALYIPINEILKFYDVSVCKVMSHDVSVCIVMSLDVSLCLVMSRDVP